MLLLLPFCTLEALRAILLCTDVLLLPLAEVLAFVGLGVFPRVFAISVFLALDALFKRSPSFCASIVPLDALFRGLYLLMALDSQEAFDADS
jgi:hypothetical protein